MSDSASFVSLDEELRAISFALENGMRMHAALEAVGLLREKHRAAVLAERYECAKLCDEFAQERKFVLDTIRNDPRKDRPLNNDQRVEWLACKQSEAERCRDAIRARSQEEPQHG